MSCGFYLSGAENPRRIFTLKTNEPMNQEATREVRYTEISDSAVMALVPVVSVHMITYNHAPYIAQAIEGVLQQKTSFPFELVIGEDCSNDETREVVFEFQLKFPGLIRVITSDKNVGMIMNWCRTMKGCRGKYIALCEGDDYWTSPIKLQKQVDFLDSHSGCSACFHNVNVEYVNNPEKNHIFHNTKMKNIFTLLDIVSNHFIPTCSTIFRAGLFGEFPDWYSKIPMGDWPLHVLNAQHGDYGYIDEILATYRVHDGGVWSSQNRVDILEKTIVAENLVNCYLNYKYKHIFRHKKSKWYEEIALIELKKKNISGYVNAAVKSVINNPSFINAKFYMKLLLNYFKFKY
jgi:glycosyltransferase involved in cell wall biosynthesis